MDLRSYYTRELALVIDEDRWAVRDEAVRRSDKLAAKIIRARAALAKMEAEQAELGRVYEMACAYA